MNRNIRKTHTQLIAILLLIPLIAPACKQLPTPLPDTPQATIEITEIVDKTTLQPITHNTITLHWENVQGEMLDTKVLHDQTDLVTTLPADGKASLKITIEAPGYKTWSNVFQMKLEKDQTLSTPVEMQKQAGTQG